MTRPRSEVSVLVPYTTDCPHRQRAWEWVSRTYVGWEVIEGHTTSGRWCKAEAVADALDRATGQILVIADADVWNVAIPSAVNAVRAGAGWAMPHMKVRRLTETATRDAYAGRPFDTFTLADLAERPYIGLAGGGIIALTRRTYEQIPLDPRFTGWGGEDQAWGMALETFLGGPWRANLPLWHLWHPPQARTSRAKGTAATEALRARYRQACHQKPDMRALLEEVRSCRSEASSPAPSH